MAYAGAVKRTALCMVLCVVAGCGSSPSQNTRPITPVTPTPVEPAPPRPLAGAWTGMFDVASCVGSSEWCPTRRAEPFSLFLDGSAHGVAELEPLRWQQPIAVDVTQSDGTDGSTTLKGVSTIPGQPRMEVEIQLEGSAPSGLTGSIRYTISDEPPNVSRPSVATRTGPILFIRPVTTLRAGAVQGTWRGYMIRTACSGDCDDVRISSEVTLLLSQQSSTLTGTLNGDDLEGTATDQTFTLKRDVRVAVCRRAQYDQRNRCEDTVDFQGSVDSLDRMRGTIQRRQVGDDYHSGPFSWTATFELEGVVRAR